MSLIFMMIPKPIGVANQEDDEKPPLGANPHIDRLTDNGMESKNFLSKTHAVPKV